MKNETLYFKATPTSSIECGCDDSSRLQLLMSVDEARCRMLSKISDHCGYEQLGLSNILGRVNCDAIFSSRPSPDFNNSAMDGFAVRTSDLSGEGPWCLPVLTTVAAGDPGALNHVLSSFGAVRIFTGAPIPDGFDAVIMQEACEFNDDLVCFHKKPVLGQNIRIQGSEMASGSLILDAGRKIRPQDIGLLASNGYGKVRVFRKPRIAVMSTGDELVPPGKPLEEGKIYDSNRPLIVSFCESLGASVEDLGIVPDTFDDTCAAIKSCREDFDLVLSSGAVSVGEKDHVKSALQASGGSVEFWRIAIKPGKPMLFGSIGRTKFAGLPGNPLAVFVALQIFIKPLIEKLSGQTPSRPRQEEAISGSHIKRKPGRAAYIPVKADIKGSENRPVLFQQGNGSSGSLASLVDADGLMIVPADNAEIDCGEKVTWQRFW